jgi:hypothetical protein
MYLLRGLYEQLDIWGRHFWVRLQYLLSMVMTVFCTSNTAKHTNRHKKYVHAANATTYMYPHNAICVAMVSN